MKDPEKAEKILVSYLKKYGLYKDYKKREIIEKWGEIVKDRFFYLTPLYFEKDVLICKLNNLNYLDEAIKKREDLKKELNIYLGKYNYNIKQIKIVK